jgi:hypothetical protein
VRSNKKADAIGPEVQRERKQGERLPCGARPNKKIKLKLNCSEFDPIQTLPSRVEKFEQKYSEAGFEMVNNFC